MPQGNLAGDIYPRKKKVKKRLKGVWGDTLAIHPVQNSTQSNKESANEIEKESASDALCKEQVLTGLGQSPISVGANDLQTVCSGHAHLDL